MAGSSSKVSSRPKKSKRDDKSKSHRHRDHVTHAINGVAAPQLAAPLSAPAPGPVAQQPQLMPGPAPQQQQQLPNYAMPPPFSQQLPPYQMQQPYPSPYQPYMQMQMQMQQPFPMQYSSGRSHHSSHRKKSHRKSKSRRHKSAEISWLPDFSTILAQLAPYLCCGGTAILVLYMLYKFASSALCSFVTSIPILGSLFSSMCGGSSSSSSSLLGATGDIAGTLIQAGGTVVSASVGTFKGVLTDAFTHWP